MLELPPLPPPSAPTAPVIARGSSRVSPLLRGVVAGAVAWAAALGVLLGIGRRSGTIWRPLNTAAHTLLGAGAEGVWDFSANVTPAGGLVVLAVCAVAGIATAWCAPSRYNLRGEFVAAAGIALLGYFVHRHVVARIPGGLALLLSTGELRVLYLWAAIALLAGMRYAFPAGREGTPS